MSQGFMKCPQGRCPCPLAEADVLAVGTTWPLVNMKRYMGRLIIAQTPPLLSISVSNTLPTTWSRRGPDSGNKQMLVTSRGRGPPGPLARSFPLSFIRSGTRTSLRTDRSPTQIRSWRRLKASAVIKALLRLRARQESFRRDDRGKETIRAGRQAAG